MSLVKLNPQLWIYLQLAHVPGRDDRRALKGWIDYRSDAVPGPYFGSGSQRLPEDLAFQYDVRFASQIRPPRPISRYNNGYQMKFDLVRAHLRMTNNLQPRDEVPSAELKKIASDLDECAAIFERLSISRELNQVTPGERSQSVVAQQLLAGGGQATRSQSI